MILKIKYFVQLMQVKTIDESNRVPEKQMGRYKRCNVFQYKMFKIWRINSPYTVFKLSRLWDLIHKNSKTNHFGLNTQKLKTKLYVSFKLKYWSRIGKITLKCIMQTQIEYLHFRLLWKEHITVYTARRACCSVPHISSFIYAICIFQSCFLLGNCKIVSQHMKKVVLCQNDFKMFVKAMSGDIALTQSIQMYIHTFCIHTLLSWFLVQNCSCSAKS